MAMITDRVDLARRGENDTVVCRLSSGWVVLGDVQVLRGWCLLLPDPVVPSLNDLDDAARAVFLCDMARLGDAILKVTKAERINYEILGNSSLDTQMNRRSGEGSRPGSTTGTPRRDMRRADTPICERRYAGHSSAIQWLPLTTGGSLDRKSILKNRD
jgi:hypothetical protein